MKNLTVKNVSYLQARDPSIVSWNRADIRRINLAEELVSSTDSNSELVCFLYCLPFIYIFY